MAMEGLARELRGNWLKLILIIVTIWRRMKEGTVPRRRIELGM
jgi:hypothetical protein